MASPSFVVGIVGNVISILVFASPITTFSRIVRKRSTLNYEGLPYVTTLLSTSLWSYYGVLKPGGLLIVTVNGSGCLMQATYVTLFLIFAPPKTRMMIAKLVGAFNVMAYGVVILVTLLASHGSLRLLIVGSVCAALTVGMYAAPMAAMRLVMQTKSVEFMPFSLTFFLFLNGGVWSAYAFLVKDFFIGVPNAIGFVLGTAQLILYAVYRRQTADVESCVSPQKEVVELEARVAEAQGVVAGPTSLEKGGSLPLKRTMSRQSSLTRIVKSLSLPPYENSHWTLDGYSENEDAQ